MRTDGRRNFDKDWRMPSRNPLLLLLLLQVSVEGVLLLLGVLGVLVLLSSSDPFFTKGLVQPQTLPTIMIDTKSLELLIWLVLSCLVLGV